MKKIFLLPLILISLSLNLRAAVDPANVYFVILAGGSGQRLWPLSRAHEPKQFMVVGRETLLDQAINRLLPIGLQKNIWISTTNEHEQKTRETVGHRVGNIIAEPGSRNTAPAILLSCFKIHELNPNALIVFLPADPFIPQKDYGKFAQDLRTVLEFAQNNSAITLLGVKPTYPATGYGYIEFDVTSAPQAPYKVIHFREKPSEEVAKDYVQLPTMLWNIGMFCAKVSVFMEEFHHHAPEIFTGIDQFCACTMPYDQVKADSIDYAVMEKSDSVFVLPVDFSWCDVGNLEVFLKIKDEFGTHDQKSIMVNAKNNLVDVPGKLVALVGVDDLAIVETDEALLITKRDQAEYVREVVKQLKKSEHKKYL